MNTVHLDATVSPDLDPVLRAFRKDTKFVLGPGRFVTEGASAFQDLDWCMLAPGCELLGEGSDRTTIALKKRSTDLVYREILTGGSRYGSSRSVAVEGITIDADSKRPSVGLHLWSAGAFVGDVRVINLWGDWSEKTRWEAFGILVNNSGAGAEEVQGGCHIEDCHVEAADLGPNNESQNYVCAIYLGTRKMEGGRILRSEVSGCTATFLGLGMAHCAYGINSLTTIRDSSAMGFDRGVFSDTGEGEDSSVVDCYLEARYAGIDFKGVEKGGDRRNIAVRNCDVILTGTPKADHVVALVLADAAEGRNLVQFAHVRMEGCRLDNRSSRPAYLSSVDALKAAGNGALDCCVRGEWRQPVITPRVPAEGWVQTINGVLA